MTKILIIDDDQDIIDSLSMILEANDYDVEAKKDTDNLIEDVKKINPDFIILDIIFPEDPQAGFKAARDFHNDPQIKRIPILILSAVNIKSNLAFSFSESDISEDFMPVNAFLEKPIEPKVLLAKIDSLLNS